MTKFLVLGNWKSNGRITDLDPFAETFHKLSGTFPEDMVSGIALPFHMIHSAGSLSPHWLGAQNVSAHSEGAYTGEITSGMLSEIHTRFCLVGHSERRQYFNETVQDTHAKLHRLLKAGIYPVFCIGETLKQRQEGMLEPVLREQLSPVLKLDGGAFAIAYEPVWAIGTGVAATPADVAQAHGMIRGMLSGTPIEQTPILYGGSVKPENARDLATIDEVAGFLVGGASLKADHFAAITDGFLRGKQLRS